MFCQAGICARDDEFSALRGGASGVSRTSSRPPSRPPPGLAHSSLPLFAAAHHASPRVRRRSPHEGDARGDPLAVAQQPHRGPERVLGVVHNAQTLMVPVARALAGDAVEKLPIFTKDGNREIFQAKVVVLGADVFFVLCTATRVLVYDQKGYMLRHSRAVPGSPSAVAGPSGEFSLVNHARGVCSACSADARARSSASAPRGEASSSWNTTARALRRRRRARRRTRRPLADLASEVDSPRRRAAGRRRPETFPRLRRRGGPGRGLERPERRSIRAELFQSESARPWRRSARAATR